MTKKFIFPHLTRKEIKEYLELEIKELVSLTATNRFNKKVNNNFTQGYKFGLRFALNLVKN